MTQINTVKMTDTIQTLTKQVNETISKINTISVTIQESLDKVTTWGDLKKESSE